MSPREVPPQRSRAWPTAAKWLAGVLIVLALAAGATYSYRQQAELARGRAQWEAEVARVRASGEPLTESELEAFGKIPDAEEDLTLQYLKALASCRTDHKVAGDLPIVGLGDDQIPIPPEPWPQLEQAEAFLERYHEPLVELIELGNRRGATRINAHDIQQLQDLRSANRLFQLQMRVQTHRRDYIGAADSLIAMHQLTNALRYEPVGTAQVIRAALSRSTSWQVVPLVQDRGLPVAQLSRLQKSLGESDWHGAFFLSCLALRSHHYELVQKPISVAFPQAAREFRLNPSSILLRSRPADAAHVLSIHSDYVDAARGRLPTVIAGFRAVGLKVADWSHEVNSKSTSNGKRPATTMENIALSYTGVYQPDWFLGAAADENAAIAVLAVERYRRERGNLPDTLDDLVPDFLAAVPEDPCNSYPMRIVKRNGGYAVYGVGIDLVDNVGDVDTKAQHRRTDDGLFVPAPVTIESDGQSPGAVER